MILMCIGVHHSPNNLNAWLLYTKTAIIAFTAKCYAGQRDCRSVSKFRPISETTLPLRQLYRDWGTNYETQMAPSSDLGVRQNGQIFLLRRNFSGVGPTIICIFKFL